MSTPHEAVVDKFTKRVAVAIDYHGELLLAVHLKRHQAALETMLVEQFVLSVAVLWELFLSDLLLTYLAESPSLYLAAFRKKLLQSLKDRYGSGAAKYTRIDFPRQVSRPAVVALVDPKNFNITVKSAAALSEKANELLAAEFAKMFSLGSDDGQFFDFGIAIRNYLGHRSDASRVVLKKAIRGLQGPNADLAGPFQSVGPYLKQRNAAGDTRSIVIARRFVAVANTLR